MTISTPRPLLAERHARHRVRFPALDPSFEEREAARLEIPRALGTGRCVGCHRAARRARDARSWSGSTRTMRRGARTSGSTRPATRPRAPRTSATSTASSPSNGSPLDARPTRSSFPRPRPTSSTLVPPRLRPAARPCDSRRTRRGRALAAAPASSFRPAERRDLARARRARPAAPDHQALVTGVRRPGVADARRGAGRVGGGLGRRAVHPFVAERRGRSSARLVPARSMSRRSTRVSRARRARAFSGFAVVRRRGPRPRDRARARRGRPRLGARRAMRRSSSTGG